MQKTVSRIYSKHWQWKQTYSFRATSQTMAWSTVWRPWRIRLSTWSFKRMAILSFFHNAFVFIFVPFFSSGNDCVSSCSERCRACLELVLLLMVSSLSAWISWCRSSIPQASKASREYDGARAGAPASAASYDHSCARRGVHRSSIRNVIHSSCAWSGIRPPAPVDEYIAPVSAVDATPDLSLGTPRMRCVWVHHACASWVRCTCSCRCTSSCRWVHLACVSWVRCTSTSCCLHCACACSVRCTCTCRWVHPCASGRRYTSTCFRVHCDCACSRSSTSTCRWVHCVCADGGRAPSTCRWVHSVRVSGVCSTYTCCWLHRPDANRGRRTAPVRKAPLQLPHGLTLLQCCSWTCSVHREIKMDMEWWNLKVFFLDSGFLTHVVATTMCVRRSVYTHTPCRTHICLTQFLCVTYRHRVHARLKVFAVCMSYLSISPSPLSCFIPPSLLFPHSHFETTFPSAPSWTVPDAKARVKRTYARAQRSLASWPIPRTPQVMSPRSSTRSVLQTETRRPSTIRTTMASLTSRKPHARAPDCPVFLQCLIEASVSQVSHGVFALQRESKESMPLETVARQAEEREGSVISVGESMSRKKSTEQYLESFSSDLQKTLFWWTRSPRTRPKSSTSCSW